MRSLCVALLGSALLGLLILGDAKGGTRRRRSSAKEPDDSGVINLGIVGIVDLTNETFFNVIGREQWAFVMFHQAGCGACKEDTPVFEKLAKQIERSNNKKSLARSVIAARVEDKPDYGGTMANTFNIESYPAYRLFVPQFSTADVAAGGKRYVELGRDGATLKVDETLEFIEDSLDNYEADGLSWITGKKKDRGKYSVRTPAKDET